MPKKPIKKKLVAPPSSLYRLIAVSFIVAVLVLLGVVSYFSLTRATIVITPAREASTATLTVDLRPIPEAGEVRGAVVEKIVEAARTFPVEEGSEVGAQATGRVVIKNTTGRDQPLVRTTRLLTPEGILARISKTVLVPAAGEVEVEAYADELGPGGEIPPTRFTIPGLAASLQDKIYASSSAPFCCGTQKISVITEELLVGVEAELSRDMLLGAEEALRAGAGDAAALGGEIFLSELIERKSDAEVGDERSEVTIALTLQVVGVFYDRSAVETLARETLQNLAGAERALIELDSDRIVVTVPRRDPRSGTARLTVEATGLLVLRPESSIFKPERLAGLDRVAVESYFKAFRSIEAVRVEFRPPWLRYVPRLKDHIEIRIED